MTSHHHNSAAGDLLNTPPPPLPARLFRKPEEKATAVGSRTGVAESLRDGGRLGKERIDHRSFTVSSLFSFTTECRSEHLHPCVLIPPSSTSSSTLSPSLSIDFRYGSATSGDILNFMASSAVSGNKSQFPATQIPDSGDLHSFSFFPHQTQSPTSKATSSTSPLNTIFIITAFHVLIFLFTITYPFLCFDLYRQPSLSFLLSPNPTKPFLSFLFRFSASLIFMEFQGVELVVATVDIMCS